MLYLFCFSEEKTLFVLSRLRLSMENDHDWIMTPAKSVKVRQPVNQFVGLRSQATVVQLPTTIPPCLSGGIVSKMAVFCCPPLLFCSFIMFFVFVICGRVVIDDDAGERGQHG